MGGTCCCVCKLIRLAAVRRNVAEGLKVAVNCGKHQGPLRAVSDILEFLRMQDSTTVNLVGLGSKLTINTRRTEVWL
jgi:hypothetical protein